MKKLMLIIFAAVIFTLTEPVYSYINHALDSPDYFVIHVSVGTCNPEYEVLLRFSDNGGEKELYLSNEIHPDKLAELRASNVSTTLVAPCV